MLNLPMVTEPPHPERISVVSGQLDCLTETAQKKTQKNQNHPALDRTF